MEMKLEEMPEILMLEHEEFMEFERKMEIIVDGRTDIPQDCISLAFTMKDRNVIIVNKTVYDGMDQDHKDIIILHEIAHCEGIEGEEEADRWVVDTLEVCDEDRSEALRKLKNMWELRHGHKYKELGSDLSWVSEMPRNFR